MQQLCDEKLFIALIINWRCVTSLRLFRGDDTHNCVAQTRVEIWWGSFQFFFDFYVIFGHALYYAVGETVYAVGKEKYTEYFNADHKSPEETSFESEPTSEPASNTNWRSLS